MSSVSHKDAGLQPIRSFLRSRQPQLCLIQRPHRIMDGFLFHYCQCGEYRDRNVSGRSNGTKTAQSSSSKSFGLLGAQVDAGRASRVLVTAALLRVLKVRGVIQPFALSKNGREHDYAGVAGACCDARVPCLDTFGARLSSLPRERRISNIEGFDAMAAC